MCLTYFASNLTLITVDSIVVLSLGRNSFIVFVVAFVARKPLPQGERFSCHKLINTIIGGFSLIGSDEHN